MNFECGSNVVIGASRFCPAKPTETVATNPPKVEPTDIGVDSPPGDAPPAPAVAFELKHNEVALTLFAGDVGLHIGFVFCPEGGTFKFVHLAFHHLLRVDDCPLDRCSIIGKLPFKLQSLRYLRHALTRIGTDLPNIPYGVRIARKKGSFNSRGRYALPVDDADGLTCATFVVEVCRGIGVPVLIESDWQPRPAEDAGWIDQICAMLANPRFGATPEHIARVRAGFNGLRIRPEDVAAIIPQWRKDGKPLAFNVVDVERKSIANQALTCCSECIEVDPAQLNAVAAPPEEKATVEGMSLSSLLVHASAGPGHAGDD
jgi:hypothetical protein